MGPSGEEDHKRLERFCPQREPRWAGSLTAVTRTFLRLAGFFGEFKSKLNSAGGRFWILSASRGDYHGMAGRRPVGGRGGGGPGREGGFPKEPRRKIVQG